SAFRRIFTTAKKNATSQFRKSKRSCGRARGNGTPRERWRSGHKPMTKPAGGSDPTPIRLSIIVPSFNEELRLPPSLDRIAAYVEASEQPTEVLVVDDGSKDKTAEVAASYAGRIANLCVLKNGENRGKGYSVRHGMLEAKGEVVLFTDADLSAPI